MNRKKMKVLKFILLPIQEINLIKIKRTPNETLFCLPLDLNSGLDRI
jgi:hypothetical protein